MQTRRFWLRFAGAVLCLLSGLAAFGQQSKIDFARDIQPIFRQNCYACHGPALATSGLRLDRKSSALKDGARRVVPGNLVNSLLYQRLVGNEFGLQMPPTGALSPDKVAMVKAWIEQGAPWPDSLSNEVERAPIDPKAVTAVEMLRSGDRTAFLKAVAGNPKLLNARGPEGSSPFMYAVLYTDGPTLDALLKKDANPNLKNDANATALMWAATSLTKTRILLAHDAEVNAISDDLRTPLMIAAGVPGNISTVKLLLDHGANLNPTKHPDSESSPLDQAALAADPEVMRLLIDRGADVKASAGQALILALDEDCRKCADVLMEKNLDKDVYTGALQSVANFADAVTVRKLIDRGAAVDAPDPLGHTALAYAAGSDMLPLDVVKLLVERGANVNAKSPHVNSGDTGMTVLDIARFRGQTPVTEFLVSAGAKPRVALPVLPAGSGTVSAKQAIERSLPLMQRADAGFTAKAGCISCHNDSFAAMAVGLARDHGFAVDEALAHQQQKVTVQALERSRDLLHQGYAGGGPATDTFFTHVLGYELMGLKAEGYKADLNTDAVAMYIRSHQMPNGNWPYPAADTRPPLCSDYIGQTAVCMRALQLYAPAVERAEYDRAIGLAAAWLTSVEAKTTQDHIWKLLGVSWAARDKNAIAKARQQLLALQRTDGGWGDLPTMGTSVFATGQALVVLEISGLSVSDPAYRRGMDYLLKSQRGDGSWFVQTRALGFQPFFESGFPHGVNQAISAAGTAWATMALTLGSGSVEAKTPSAGGTN